MTAYELNVEELQRAVDNTLDEWLDTVARVGHGSSQERDLALLLIGQIRLTALRLEGIEATLDNIREDVLERWAND
jgi:hypothetical protein